MIELTIGKTINLRVANKYCSIRAKNLEKDEQKELNCFVNYDGSSSGMESELYLRAMRKLDREYEIQKFKESGWLPMETPVHTRN